MNKWCCFCFQEKSPDAFDKQPKNRLFHICLECSFSISPYKNKTNMRHNLSRRLSPDVYLYVVQSVVGGPIKIGVSKDVAKRIVGLQPASPFKLTAIRIFDKIPSILETRLHYKLAEHKLHGEWFREEALLLVDAYMERVFKNVEGIKAILEEIKVLGERTNEIRM